MDINQIKTSVNIFDILDHYGIRHQGNFEHSINCFLHADTKPSLRIYPDANKLHCFGACSRSYDCIDVVMAMENCDLPNAVNKIQEWFGIQELRSSYVTKFWQSMESVKKHNEKRDRMELAWVMMREFILKYWPDVRVKLLAPLFIEYDEIVEGLRTGAVQDTQKLREWYDKAVAGWVNYKTPQAKV
jgi:DNA primase